MSDNDKLVNTQSAGRSRRTSRRLIRPKLSRGILRARKLQGGISRGILRSRKLQGGILRGRKTRGRKTRGRKLQKFFNCHMKCWQKL